MDMLYILEGNPSYGLTLPLAVISRDFMNKRGKWVT